MTGRGPTGRRRARGVRADRGQTAVEYLGWLPVLLLVALAAVQFGIAAYGVQQAGTGARAAARTASIGDGDPTQAARAAVSDWLDLRITGGGYDQVTYTATVTIPSLVPGVGDFTATRSATMPVTDDG
ncbi:TadE/TadG family type IV pilus assembly protein [Streptomyces sp. NPDC059176]|uniref:TadE/TadG family type IV pilus assembly protein n=1 Tax=unclassified Streptomyces TaxID=2593676 RepID=UPI0036B12EE6